MKKNTNKVVLILSLGIGLSYLCFLLYYLIHTRAELLNDFIQKTPSFYRYQIFVTNIFTEDLKQQGNKIVLIAVAALALFLFLLIPFFKAVNTPLFENSKHRYRTSTLWLFALVVYCMVLNFYSHTSSSLCTDEAFSVVNFAQKPMFHLLCYYPLPNNHIFFNLLNHFLGKLSVNYILSGSLLSGFCFTLLICSNYLFIQSQIQNKCLSFLCSALLAQQLMVWGFGAQSRGYALYYLFQWGSFLGFYHYFFDTNSNKKLNLLLIIGCNILGAWTIPSYLYFLLFQMAAGLLAQLYKKQLDFWFWKTILLSLLGAFLVYVPVFCYSGLASVFSNKYVSGAHVNTLQILGDWNNYFTHTIALSTFGFASFNSFLATSLFALPLLLSLIFKKHLRAIIPISLLAIAMWLAVVFMVLYMKQIPVLRSLGFQMHFALLIVLLSVASLFIAFLKKRLVLQVSFLILFILATYATIQYNKTAMDTELYGQNTAAFMRDLKGQEVMLSKNQALWLSDESYMWNFLLPKDTWIINYDCAFAQQEVLIISEDDKVIPGLNLNDYTLVQKISWFSIYHRK